MNITINYFNLDTEQKAEIQVYTKIVYFSGSGFLF